MRRLALLLSAAALLAAPAPVQAAFGLHDLEVSINAENGSAERLAGSHPFELRTDLAIDTVVDPVLDFPVPTEDMRDLRIDLPPGLVADRSATPQCVMAEFRPPDGGEPECVPASAVGFAKVEYGNPGNFDDSLLYNLVPSPGSVATFGFMVEGVPVTVEGRLSEQPPYHAIATVSKVLQVFPVYSSSVTLWGNPGDDAHDAERGGPAGFAERPFLTLPRSCSGPLETDFLATSWQGGVFAQTVQSEGEGGEPLAMTECQSLGFSPELTAQPTNRSAESPSGIDVELQVTDPGLANPAGRAMSDIQKAVVALPVGMTANPSLAEGLGACSEAELERETLTSAPGEGCPQSAKVGTVEAESPLLEGVTVKGQLYIATQGENPFKSLLALYLVIKDPGLGILIKLAGKIEPDLGTGQLITTFGEAPFELPQVPLSHVRLRLREGARSPLITPPGCGTHTTVARFTPWADPSSSYETTSSFELDSGPGGGPCPPPGPPPFDPGLRAGTQSNDAASYSPFYLRLTRRDGDQDLTRFSFELPPGMTADLSGLTRCSETEIAAAKAKSGRAELASPSCPEGSRIGTVQGGAGVGAQLTYVPGNVYLSTPYNGAPLSVVAIVPAVAGPFDVGTVVTRQALDVHPRTATATVDGSRSDPIPHILAGIPLKVRDVRVLADRPDFTLNPTNCDPFSVSAELWGGGTNAFSSADDAPVSRSVPFQAANCARLAFKPRLSLRLEGGTKRGQFPAFRFLYRPRPSQANLRRLALRLPRSEFIEQAHFRTICTRVQFAAGAGNGAQCPKGSVYGRATVKTPILDQPLTGPVFLRSSDNNLPDVVLALQGPPELPINFEVPTRIDSLRGGLRAIAQATPDVPVSRVDLRMQGGQKGLFVNSRNICAKRYRADLRLIAQSNRRLHLQPVLHATGCKNKRSSSKRRR